MRHEQYDLTKTRWTLIGRLKNVGDQESWRDFFETYWKLIYAVSIKSGLSHEEAQDAVQETVMSVCRGIKNFKVDPAAGSFKSWLLKLTHWRITDQMRKRAREELHSRARGYNDSGRNSTGTSTQDRIPDPAGVTLEAIWEQEWREHLVQRALRQVKKQANAKHYQIFYLDTIKEVPPEKIAETLGVTVQQVYLIKHRLSKVFEESLRTAETGTL